MLLNRHQNNVCNVDINDFELISKSHSNDITFTIFCYQINIELKSLISTSTRRRIDDILTSK